MLVIEQHFENISEVFTGFGERGVAAEEVAKKAVLEARRYLASGVPVGRYLADQLLLPMSIAGKGAFITLAPTKHTLTNIEVIRQFLDLNILCEEVSDRGYQVSIDS